MPGSDGTPVVYTTVYWFGNYEEEFVNSKLTARVKLYSSNEGVFAQRTVTLGENENVTGDTLSYMFKDQLGSTLMTFGTDGKLTGRYAYEPFGKMIYREEAALNGMRRTFTGHMLEDDEGLYYCHARWYDATVGRFLQADSVLDGFNRYAYCRNNPVSFCDPSGNSSEGEESKEPGPATTGDNGKNDTSKNGGKGGGKGAGFINKVKKVARAAVDSVKSVTKDALSKVSNMIKTKFGKSNTPTSQSAEKAVENAIAPQVPDNPNDYHCDIIAWNEAINDGMDPRADGESWDGNGSTVDQIYNEHNEETSKEFGPNCAGEKGYLTYDWTGDGVMDHMEYCSVNSDGLGYTYKKTNGIDAPESVNPSFAVDNNAHALNGGPGIVRFTPLNPSN